MNVDFFSHHIIIYIAKIELINEYITPLKAFVISLILPFLNNSNATNKPAPAIVGIDNNIENFAASLRSSPRILPMVMVMPERLVPGIKAKHCAQPINIASFTFIEEVFRSVFPYLSAKYNIMP